MSVAEVRDSIRRHMAQHRPYPWWALQRRHRCRQCGELWPCQAYRAAKSAPGLVRGQITLSEADTVAFGTAPLLTKGQEWRTNPSRYGRWWQ